ncbi:N-acetylneuraminate lyase-like [Fopius arisanus]|uniref:N-acetylneuraminate lyase n=1 Tax=Fopius arisanus TaxID=64838 RepID=A0A9R1TE24_9HYME|nr:PREDICTED: N-acetylneuraminate lyase-like [Fopius arisanus]
MTNMSKLSYTFRGLIVPVLAPFTERLTLNLPIIPTYAKYLADNGVNGVLVNGTTGEGMSMSVDERKHVAESWANTVKETNQHLMIQVGGAPLPDVIELAKHAAKNKADSILCLPELYFKPANVNELIDYLKIIGEAAPKTPLLYYHFPVRSNVNLHMGKFLETIRNEIPSFVGIKFTSTNLEEGSQALRADSKRFVVFQGSNEILSAGCAIGMDSCIPSSTNVFPENVQQIVDAGMRGDGLKAREAQEKLNKALSIISKYGNWSAALKCAMSLITPINPGPTRPPNHRLTPEDVNSMSQELQALGYSVKK